MSTPMSGPRLSACLSLLLTLLLTACASAPQSPAAQVPRGTETVHANVPLLAPAVAYAAEAETAPPAPPTPTELPPPPLIPDPAATPTPRPVGTAPRVGLQVGHLHSNELPDEMAQLRTSAGAHWGNVSEASLNLDIANRVKPLLEAQGVSVELLPATVPPGYDADAFVALHSDGSNGGSAHGWKLATPWRASEASKQLFGAMAGTYGGVTGMPEDVGGVTFNMKGYYAFNFRRYDYAIARTTPAIIVEMGFMTSAVDRAMLFNQPDRVARGLAEGIMAYLRQRDPANGAALLPPEYPALQAATGGATVRAAPRDNARVLARVSADARLMPFDKQNGYYQVFVHSGKLSTVGWVREDQVVNTSEQSTFPTPASQ